MRAEVELWDASGSSQYERCWPAIQRSVAGCSQYSVSVIILGREAHGVIFVFNPDSAAQAKQLDTFHQAFVAGRSLPDTAQVVFAHFLSGDQVSISLLISISMPFTPWSDKSSPTVCYI